MSIGSISSSTVSTTTVDPKRGEARAAPPEKTIAEHVEAVDDQEPIRSSSTTRGTLVDTYL
jgi:hypothetical protein